MHKHFWRLWRAEADCFIYRFTCTCGDKCYVYKWDFWINPRRYSTARYDNA